MASLGPNSPSNAVTDGTGGVNWVNPTYVFAHDSLRASVTLSDFDSQTTDFLQATGFGFSIPSGATINGIVAEVERKASHSTGVSISDAVVKLLKAGVEVGSNKAAGGTWTSTESYQSYGGASDLWGTSWSVAEINASDFGLEFQVDISLSTSQLRSAQINHIRITVYYTAGGGGGGAAQGNFFQFF